MNYLIIGDVHADYQPFERAIDYATEHKLHLICVGDLIDNGNDGASIDLNGDLLITTNDNDMKFLASSGEIYLNTESDEQPLVRGQVLVDLLKDLCSELQKEIHPTPAGPSAPPSNASAYAGISNKLDTILSTLNFTE